MEVGMYVVVGSRWSGLDLQIRKWLLTQKQMILDDHIKLKEKTAMNFCADLFSLCSVGGWVSCCERLRSFPASRSK